MRPTVLGHQSVRERSVAVAGQRACGDDDDPARSTAAVEPAEPEDNPAEHAVRTDPDEAIADSTEAPTSPHRGPAVPLRLLLLVTVVNLLLAVGLFALRPPWRVERMTAPPALPAQVAELQARVARGEHGAPYTLALTDAELTATAQYFLAQSADVPFTQVRVVVVDGHLEATGVTTGLAVAVPIKIVANVEARNGAPVVTVVDAGVGGLALPAFVREQVVTEANRAVDLSQYNMPVTIDAVILRPGALDLHGTVR
jgi:hypothetical protein